MFRQSLYCEHCSLFFESNKSVIDHKTNYCCKRRKLSHSCTITSQRNAVSDWEDLFNDGETLSDFQDYDVDKKPLEEEIQTRASNFVSPNSGVNEDNSNAVSPNSGLNEDRPISASLNSVLNEDRPNSASPNSGGNKVYPISASLNSVLNEDRPISASLDSGVNEDYPISASLNSVLNEHRPDTASPNSDFNEDHRDSDSTISCLSADLRQPNSPNSDGNTNPGAVLYQLLFPNADYNYDSHDSDTDSHITVSNNSDFSEESVPDDVPDMLAFAYRGKFLKVESDGSPSLSEDSDSNDSESKRADPDREYKKRISRKSHRNTDMFIFACLERSRRFLAN